MINEVYHWVKVAESLADIAFEENQIAEFTVEGRDICLASTVSGIKAFGARCPHAGARFVTEGKIDSGDVITCCVHHYRFNLRHGRDILNEGFFLKVYPVEVRKDGVFVGIKKPATLS